MIKLSLLLMADTQIFGTQKRIFNLLQATRTLSKLLHKQRKHLKKTKIRLSLKVGQFSKGHTWKHGQRSLVITAMQTSQQLQRLTKHLLTSMQQHFLMLSINLFIKSISLLLTMQLGHLLTTSQTMATMFILQLQLTQLTKQSRD